MRDASSRLREATRDGPEGAPREDMRAGDVAVAAGVASFWRGAWYVMDACVFPDDRARSAQACAVAGPCAVGLGAAAMERWGGRVRNGRYHVLVSAIALGSVATWRGVWMMWDETCDRVNASLGEGGKLSAREVTLYGGAASALAGAATLVGMKSYASVFAPPVPMTYQCDVNVAKERWASERMTWLLKRVGRFAPRA